MTTKTVIPETGDSSSRENIMLGNRIRLGVSRLTVTVTILAIVILGGFIAYYLWNRPVDHTNPQRMADLKKAKLTRATLRLGEEKIDVWPQWRGPWRDGVSEESEFLTNWPESGPKVLWKQPCGVGYSSFAVADGKVYTMAQEGGNEVVLCWEAETGKRLWRFGYPAKFTDSYGNGPRCTPTVEDGRVYTVGATGKMHCLKTEPESEDGEVIWSKDLLSEYNSNNMRWGTSFSPLIYKDLIYVTPGGDGHCAVALDKKTGKEVWKALDGPAGYSSPIVVTLADTVQILYFTGTEVAGLNPETGEVLWQTPWETRYDCNTATPIVSDNYVFVSSGYGTGCGLFEVEKTSEGKFSVHEVYKKHHVMDTHFSSCVLHEGHVYGFNDDRFSCLDMRTGKTKWQDRKRTVKAKGACMLADGYLFIQDGDGPLVLAKATPEKFEPIVTASIGEESQCWVCPVLANGRLYTRDRNGVTCFDLLTKAPVLPKVAGKEQPTSISWIAVAAGMAVLLLIGCVALYMRTRSVRKSVVPPTIDNPDTNG